MRCFNHKNLARVRFICRTNVIFLLKRGKIFATVMLCTALICLAACSGKTDISETDAENSQDSLPSQASSQGSNQTSDKKDENKDTVEASTYVIPTSALATELGISTHEDYSTVYFAQDPSTLRFAYIDRTGSEIFHVYGTQNTYLLDPSGGATGDGTVLFHLVDAQTKKGVYAIINSSAEIVWNLGDETVQEMKSVGDGYYQLSREVSNFDENRIIIELIDGTGKTVFSTEEAADVKSINYLGEDMLSVQSTNYPQNVEILFSLKRQEYIMPQYPPEAETWNVGTGDNFWIVYDYFHDGIARFEISGVPLAWIDQDGFVQYIPVSKDESYGISGHGEGTLTIKDFEKSLFLYDLETQSFTAPDIDYLDKLVTAGRLSCNRIVLRLSGADNQAYFAIFDKNWNEILGPTPGEIDTNRAIGPEFTNNSMAFINDRLYIKDHGDEVIYTELQ